MKDMKIIPRRSGINQGITGKSQRLSTILNEILQRKVGFLEMKGLPMR